MLTHNVRHRVMDDSVWIASATFLQACSLPNAERQLSRRVYIMHYIYTADVLNVLTTREKV